MQKHFLLLCLAALTLAQSCWPAAAPTRDPLAMAATIDREIDRSLKDGNIPASPVANDAEFLRRASIDIVGNIPSAARVSAFLADKTPSKRQKAIDELLADSAYGRNFGGIWYDLLVLPNDDNRILLNRSFEKWMGEQFNKNPGWNQIVTEILTAEGSAEKNPATVFWFGHVEEAKNPKVKPAEAIGMATQRFLGTQHQCAECHDHPFNTFTQSEFWSMAAFFGKMDLDHARKKEIRNGGAIPTVKELPAGKVASIQIPESEAKEVVLAKFPDGTKYTPTGNSLRADFAAWCTSAQNEPFAMASANRTWGHFFGRGFVNPVDDFRKNNPPSHPELLKQLGAEFTASGFDLKHLIRCICNSQAYQRGSDVLPGNKADQELFSHMALKTMTPDVLLNSLSTALGEEIAAGPRAGRLGKGKAGKAAKAGKDAKPEDAPKPNAKAMYRDNSPRERFVKEFQTAEEPDLPEYSYGIPQVLRLMNGSELQDGGRTVRLLIESGNDKTKIIEALVMATLSRPATSTEIQKLGTLVTAETTPAKAYASVMWVLLNSSEFVLNH